MFILLRRIERWLHQHIFKVGWLITQNYQTTTIFYYTIFLPGVVLHELVYWLAAGMLNVRADRAIKWPEAQEVGELKLNFVHINPKAHVLRKAIITIAPLLVGLLSIWYIAHNIFDITAVFNRMSSGNLYDVGAAFQMLMAAPLFWLWVYIIFTVANTMYPSIPKDLQGWRSVLLGLGTVVLALLLLGLGGEVFEALQSPISELIFVLQATFILMIGIDVLMVLVLGLIEYTIEHATGNSATFRGGKMITVTREEAIEEQVKQRELEQKEQAKKRNPAADTGIKSVYALAFSIPGIPPQEPVTLLREHSQASIEVPAVVVEELEEKKAASMPLFGGIAANAPEEAKPISEEQKAQRESIAAKINMPERLGTPKPAEPEEKAAESPAATIASPAKPEEKRQSSLFDKAGTSETEKADEEKPVASRFGSFSKPVIALPEEDEEAEETGETEKPVASRFGAFSKPAITSPKEDDEAEEVEEKPVASRFGGFSKRAITSPIEEDDEAEEVEEKPVASRFGGFSKPAISTPKEDEEAEDEEAEEKPVASRFGAFATPAITAPKEDDAEVEEEIKPATSRFSISKSASEEEKPATSRFGSSPFKPAGEEKKEESPAASTSRFASTEFRRVEDDEDEEEKPASRLGTSPFSKPSAFGAPRPAPKTFGKEDDESEEEDDEDVSRPSSPILGRPSPFGAPRPAPKFSSVDEDEEEVEDDEEAPRSRVSGFGLLGKRPKDEEIVYEDDEDDFRNYSDDDDYDDSDDED